MYYGVLGVLGRDGGLAPGRLVLMSDGPGLDWFGARPAGGGDLVWGSHWNPQRLRTSEPSVARNLKRRQGAREGNNKRINLVCVVGEMSVRGIIKSY